jgi:hypothetical protein
MLSISRLDIKPIWFPTGCHHQTEKGTLLVVPFSVSDFDWVGMVGLKSP